MSELRDFLYLDVGKLHSFVSQIHGGLISEINETIKQLGGASAGVNVGLPSFGGKVGASKSKESERQQTLQLTDPAYFNVLYQYLIQEKKVASLKTFSVKERSNLEVGQFVEINGVAEPPVVEDWIARVKKLFDFFERNLKLFNKFQKGKGKSSQRFSQMQIREFRAILDFLEDYVALSRQDPGKQYVQISTDSGEFKTWCGLLPDYITVSLHAALPARVYVFGRVERILGEGETFKIVDFSRFNQTTGVAQLLDVLNGLTSLTGQKEIEESDLQSQYPDIFVSPIAIYR